MPDKAISRARWPASLVLYLVLLAAPIAGTGCAPEVCDIFNCDTLFFIEDLAAVLDELADEQNHGDTDAQQHDDSSDDGEGDAGHDHDPDTDEQENAHDEDQEGEAQNHDGATEDDPDGDDDEHP